MAKVGKDEACRTKRRVTTRDGGSHDTQHGQDSSKDAKPPLAHSRYHFRSLCLQRAAHFSGTAVVEEPAGHRSPDERHYALGNHGTVEDRASLALGVKATCHQGALRGVEATHGSAGYRDEKAGKNGLGGQRLHLGHLPHFGQRRPLDKQDCHQGYCHEQQGKGKKRIDATDNFVDWQHRSQSIVAEDDCYPQHDGCLRTSRHISQNEGWTEYKHCAHHQQNYEGKYK